MLHLRVDGRGDGSTRYVPLARYVPTRPCPPFVSGNIYIGEWKAGKEDGQGIMNCAPAQRSNAGPHLCPGPAAIGAAAVLNVSRAFAPALVTDNFTQPPDAASGWLVHLTADSTLTLPELHE